MSTFNLTEGIPRTTNRIVSRKKFSRLFFISTIVNENIQIDAQVKTKRDNSKFNFKIKRGGGRW